MAGGAGNQRRKRSARAVMTMPSPGQIEDPTLIASALRASRLQARFRVSAPVAAVLSTIVWGEKS